jgi:hypothetical protein
MPPDFPVRHVVIAAGHDPADADKALGIGRAEGAGPINRPASMETPLKSCEE